MNRLFLCISGMLCAAGQSLMDGNHTQKKINTHANSMEQFSTYKGFGKEVRKKSVPTRSYFPFVEGDSAIFRATDNVLGTTYPYETVIPRDGLFYLDLFHKNHLEVFGKDGELYKVVSLEGIELRTKTIAALGRDLSRMIVAPRAPLYAAMRRRGSI